MAKKVGITANVSAAANLEGYYHLILCGAGKVLEELNITGMDSKLGGLYNAETGYYELSKEDIFRDAELTAKGYTALIELGVYELTLKVKLFEDDCLLGDVNHDGIINSDDASLVEEYIVKRGNMSVDFCFYGADVNGDKNINSDDASLIREYVVKRGDFVFPAEEK